MEEVDGTFYLDPCGSFCAGRTASYNVNTMDADIAAASE
jgi:hypothetical protein